MLELIYWLSFAVLLYTYFGYPVLMLIIGKRKPDYRRDETFLPKVSLLICAYNEKDVIREKLENALATDYPGDKFEIVVVSDGSTDGTNEIIESFHDPRLKFFTYTDRGGKAKALNTGMKHLTGDIAVLTDANVLFENDAIKKLAIYFSGESIGCVVGNVILRSKDGTIVGEGVYSRYEKAVHTAEGNFNTMITVDGAMYAMRRKHLAPVPPDSLTDDWYLATGVLGLNKKIIYAPEAVGYEHAAESVAGEFKRKVRMIAGGYQTAFRRADVFLNPFKYPIISFMFFSHKLLRWTAMFFMAALCVSNLPLVFCGSWYQLTFAGQGIFYGFALMGWLYSERLKSPPFYIPYYFTAVNWAAVMGLIKYLTGGQKVTWERGRN
ncbi:MAG: glycosyltransferase [candidate division Zixibacteria bacterium]|nr:glycosyltransferase [candidate division Zixibacteria bacterium]